MVVKLNIPHIFTRDFPHLNKVEFFRKAVYIIMLFNALTLLPIAEDVYGYYGLIGTKGWNVAVPIYAQGSKGLINLLSHPANSVYYWVYIVFVVGQLVFLVTGILGKWPRLSSFLVYIITINLHMKGHLAFTGGEVLLNMVLFYLMFIHRPKSKGLFGDLQNILNNTMYYVLLWQVCLLYFFSGSYKLFDEFWLNGEAMQYVSKIEAYSSQPIEFLMQYYWISAVATYLTLIYQLLFPFVVWIKKIKVPFLIFGVLFHVIISIGMGIFYFGIIMIVMYLLFLEEKHINWIKRKLGRKKVQATAVNT